MAAPPILADVHSGPKASRLRLLAPLRYLAVYNREKRKYDIYYPIFFGLAAWCGYLLLDPKPPIFGDSGILKYSRDMLVMAVPFMVGSLAAVAMGAPGQYLDRRPPGIELTLGGKALSLRQFVCYLLGYLCFVGLCTLGFAVAADMLHPAVSAWVGSNTQGREIFRAAACLPLFLLFSTLLMTVFWSLYFLTEVVNPPASN